MYLSTDGSVIGSALVQEFEGKERVIYYLSRRLIDAETRYSAIEKLCLCLYFSCIKLRHYLLSAECAVVCKDDVVRYMLSMPIMSGRIGKWILALSEFDLRYESAKAVKGQIMANFVTQHCSLVETLELHPGRSSLMVLPVTGGQESALYWFLLRGGSMSFPCRLLLHQQIIRLSIKL